MRPLDSCRFCFKNGKSDFIEIYRNKFDGIRKIHPTKQELAENILKRYGIVLKRGFHNRQGFQTPDDRKTEIVDSLKDVGIPVHTLLDHVNQLSRIYKSERRVELKELVFVELLADGYWTAMNPTTRKWEFLKVYKSELSGANVRINSILKQEHNGTSFFRVVRTKEKNLAIPIDKLAAYNLMSDQFGDSTAYWIEKNGGLAVIDRRYLKNIPDDFFETMVRLKPTESHLDGFLVFDTEDFPLVEKLLSAIRIDLVRESDIKNIASKRVAKNITILFLNSLEQERVDFFVKILEKIGGSINIAENSIEVSGRKKKLILSFCDSPKNSMISNTYYISSKILDQPPGFEHTLKMIRNTCGLNREFLDFLIAENWPVITREDLDFVIHEAIRFYKNDIEKSKKIILKNYDAIKRWYGDIISGRARVDQEEAFIIGKLLKK